MKHLKLFLCAALTLPSMFGCAVDMGAGEDGQFGEDIAEEQEALFGNCYTNNEERGDGDLTVNSKGKNWIALNWYSPFGVNGGDVTVYYKKSWAFVGKKDGPSKTVPSWGMHGGTVVIDGLDKNDCYKFAAYQNVSGMEKLLGITKERTNKK